MTCGIVDQFSNVFPFALPSGTDYDGMPCEVLPRNLTGITQSDKMRYIQLIVENN